MPNNSRRTTYHRMPRNVEWTETGPAIRLLVCHSVLPWLSCWTLLNRTIRIMTTLWRNPLVETHCTCGKNAKQDWNINTRSISVNICFTTNYDLNNEVKMHDARRFRLMNITSFSSRHILILQWCQDIVVCLNCNQFPNRRFRIVKARSK